MDVSLTDEQQQLVAVVAGLAADLACPPPTSLPAPADEPAHWRALCDTGLVAMRLPEAHGGSAAPSADVALVAEQLGARQCLAPFLGQGVLAPELLWRAGAPGALLAELTAGHRRVTVALDERLAALARPEPASVAWDARGATHAVLVDEGGTVLLAPVADACVPTADLTRVLRPVAVDRAEAVGRIDAAGLARWHALALATLAADLVGVMQSALDAAVAHVRERVQFGVPVGSFQAVQHLAADALVALEGARSSMWHAAWAADALDPADAVLAARQAKAFCSTAAQEVVEIQLQLLGGIAITWEERAHVRVRRVLVDRVTLGDEHVHHDAIAAARLGEGVR